MSEHQKQFVAPNAVSIAQAYFSKEAWFRAIYADDTAIGFVMLCLGTVAFLWRGWAGAKHGLARSQQDLRRR